MQAAGRIENHVTGRHPYGLGAVDILDQQLPAVVAFGRREKQRGGKISANLVAGRRMEPWTAAEVHALLVTVEHGWVDAVGRAALMNSGLRSSAASTMLPSSMASGEPSASCWFCLAWMP